MNSTTLIKALKSAVRQVIKEELTEILREGLQSTITEINQPQIKRQTPASVTKRKTVQFNENRWSSILNETEPLIEQGPSTLNSLAELMNEGVDDTITMTSRDAQGFGAMRQNMAAANGLAPGAQSIMEDPETGKVYDVAPEVQQAMTRDYSALMSAINKKKAT